MQKKEKAKRGDKAEECQRQESKQEGITIEPKEKLLCGRKRKESKQKIKNIKREANRKKTKRKKWGKGLKCKKKDKRKMRKWRNELKEL